MDDVPHGCNLLLSIEGSGTIDWNTGPDSQFDFAINTDPLNGTITVSATITSGPLTGDSGIAVPVLAQPTSRPAASLLPPAARGAAIPQATTTPRDDLGLNHSRIGDS
ncbi:hypothetical protein [Streptosporangium lutulentum]|uniref:Uncharacterized protein n=1 Tax=Streptosporangium lutulentum TaxID=1461250 RepID=A0ABT9QCG9_9ACTN|nr:hypothetical protein [Streptosporangium lutulentum]MDP9843754.1 hypothetical protein [Streptosporangium lutulentum]